MLGSSKLYMHVDRFHSIFQQKNYYEKKGEIITCSYITSKFMMHKWPFSLMLQICVFWYYEKKKRLTFHQSTLPVFLVIPWHFQFKHAQFSKLKSESQSLLDKFLSKTSHAIIWWCSLEGEQYFERVLVSFHPYFKETSLKFQQLHQFQDDSWKCVRNRINSAN